MAENQTTAKQNNLLAEAKTELIKLGELRKICTQFADNFQEQIECRQQQQSEHEMLMQQYKDIKENQVKENWEYNEALKKFSEIDLDLKQQQSSSEALFYILGFKLTSMESINSTEKLVTLHYNDECFVKLKIGGVHVDLLEIQPMHPNFDAIKRMVTKTNVSGLLANLRKFFDIVMKLKEDKSN